MKTDHLFYIPCGWLQQIPVSTLHNTSLDTKKTGAGPRFVFSRPVYFVFLRVFLTAEYNCFISLKFVLIGASRVTQFTHCQSLACAVVRRARSSAAEWRWRGGGVNDLTEDSVKLTPAWQQTICSFHQQLWSLKKKQRESMRGWVVRQDSEH